jgi:hypothetical protein
VTRAPERDLTALEDLDRVSRERWSIAASEALIRSVGSEALIAIAVAGFDEFLRVSRPIYEGHAFQFIDYQRMYARIKHAAEHRAQVRLS